VARSTTTARSSGSSSSKMPLIIGGVAVLVVAVLIGVFSASGREEAVSVEDIAGAPVVVGDDLPQHTGDPAADPQLGARTPVATGTDFDGNEVTIGETGTPQLVMFLTAWCPACQAELPEVVDWLDEGNLPEGVELTAVATLLDSTRPNWPPDEWFEREGYDGPLLVDDADSTVAQAYGLNATPYWVAIDAEGQVAARLSGMVGMDQLTSLAEALAAS
jgi:thiol-disulfide isomerase/thioredoxin